MSTAQATNSEIKCKLCALYDGLFTHAGYGDLRLKIRILRCGQKEVIIYCGKQYRYVVNYRPPAEREEGS